ncbi:MAG: DUF4954 family protein, partial [Bacteroidales bacterium]|nr:DUF4954 family protein [Bacteroidales bacterium]
MDSHENYRNISPEELSVLKMNGCFSDEWERVKVQDGFDPSRCRNARFSGDVKLGAMNGIITDKSGVPVKCGLSDVHLHNCVVGSDVVIQNIGDYIANYYIEDNVIIRNCDR